VPKTQGQSAQQHNLKKLEHSRGEKHKDSNDVCDSPLVLDIRRVHLRVAGPLDFLLA
jgi:hypothetical protein